jgi:hypothetical protein
MPRASRQGFLAVSPQPVEEKRVEPERHRLEALGRMPAAACERLAVEHVALEGLLHVGELACVGEVARHHRVEL